MSETMSVQPTESEPKKRKSKGPSPTSRTLAELRKRGFTAQVVERWNQYARVRVDLFGCIDIVAITPTGILGVQATAGSGHSARRHKTLLEPRLAEWIEAGARFDIWSWSKRANGRWELRCEDMADAIRAHAAHVASKGGDVA